MISEQTLIWETRVSEESDLVEIRAYDMKTQMHAISCIDGEVWANRSMREAAVKWARRDVVLALQKRIAGEPALGARMRPKGSVDRARVVTEIDYERCVAKLEGVKREYPWADLEYAS